jgi:hypothetical protein
VNGLPKRSQHCGTGAIVLEARVVACASLCKWKVLRSSRVKERMNVRKTRLTFVAGTSRGKEACVPSTKKGDW